MLTALVGGVIFVALRVRGLTDSCLWFDEIFSVHAAGMEWGSLMSFVAKDIVHPPLSYLLLKLWIVVDSSSIHWLRLFPVVISTLALVPIALIVRDMKLGLAASMTVYLFLAFNGTLIKYAQEVRMYCLLFCLSSFSAWAYFKFFKMGKGFVALVIFNALMVYSHYFGWFIVLAEVVGIVVWQRIKMRRILTMLGIEVALFLPWVFYVYLQAEGWASMKQNLGWAEAPGLSALAGFFFDLTEPVYFQASSAEPQSYWPFSVPILILCVSLLSLILVNWKTKTEDEKSAVLRLAMFFLIPICGAFIMSVASPVSVWGTRHLLVSTVPLTLLLGVSVNAIRTNIGRNLVVFLMALLFVGSLVADDMRPDRRFVWCAWEGFAKGMSMEGARSVYLYEDLAAYQFWFARQDPSLSVFLVEDAEEMNEDKAYFLPRGFDQVRKVSERDIKGDEFFVAYSATSFDDSKAPLKKLRERGYRFFDPQMFDGGNMKSFLVRAKKE